MWTVKYFTAIALGLLLFLIGWGVSTIINNRKSANWKSRAQQAEDELKGLNKKVKNEALQSSQYKSKGEQWKNEFQVLKHDFQQSKKEWSADMQMSREKSQVKDSQIKELKSKQLTIERLNEKMRTDLDNQKIKYDKDVGDFKSWKSEKENTIREIGVLKSKIENLNSQVHKYKSKCEEQETKMEGWREMERKVKMLKTKTNKLEKDVEYWEKKHYDTHHELANLKKQKEGFQTEFLKLEELRKGDEILKGNLLKQIEEFKTKFLDVSDKYRTLVNRSN